MSTPKMELIAKHTLRDKVTFELMASIIVGVCPDESQQFTPLRVILQVENSEIWSQKMVCLLLQCVVLSVTFLPVGPRWPKRVYRQAYS